MCKLLVLLAAYNGRQWIDEQIDSILSQKNVQVDLLVSVDLSTDDTFHYLQDKYPNINYLPYGERFGSAGKNFYRLVLEADFSDYDYIAFSDQDDIWLADKLSCGVEAIISKNVDAYSSNVTAFWDNGYRLLLDKSQPQVTYDYLFEAAGPGCTYIFNKKLALAFQHFLNTKTNATEIALHDWLLYAFARHNGFDWFISNESKMLYRQHENNEVGANETLQAAFKRYRMTKNGWYKKEILKIAEALECDDNPIIQTINRHVFFPSLFIIKNIDKIRRRPRDRYAFMLFHLLRLI